MPTLRQMQRLFSTAARENKAVRVPHGLAGDGLFERPAALPDGSVGELCTCVQCRARGTVPDVRKWLDRMARLLGPNTDLQAALRSRRQAEGQGQTGQGQTGQGQTGQGQTGQGQTGQGQTGQGQTGQGQTGQGQTGQGQTGQGQTGQGQTGQGQTGQDAAEDAAREAAEDAAEDAAREAAEKAATAKTAAAAAAAKAAALETAEKRHTLREQAAAAKAEVRLVKSTRARRRARNKLRQARRALSHDAKKEAAGVSLTARRQVSRGLARLNNVPTSLKVRMANLISRLVAQGGTTGSVCGPIPALSATKLVKRLVVRRPLPNALKEDIVTGRPVILFLPDISPSCAEQAQPACDLANAAGYAGVRGSDVLVLPHFNGGIDSEEEYVPWFNGRPAAKHLQEVRRLFDDVCSGKSSFRIRVAVFVGDHDAEEQYRRVAENPTITRVLWLHNFSTTGGKPEAAPRNIVPDWPAHILRKLSMVSNCTDLKTMLCGFDTALNLR